MLSRFCDFVTGSSQELYELFADLKKMFHQTGYILQQVAFQNFSMKLLCANSSKTFFVVQFVNFVQIIKYAVLHNI